MNSVETILEKYNNGTATKEEIILVESWYLRYKTPEVDLNHEQIEEEYNIGLADLSMRINTQPSRLWPRIAAAASILLFLSAGGYFLLHKEPFKQLTQNRQHEIAPGINKATLTLANGQKIILTNGLTGKLAQQGTTAIRMNSNNAISYVSSTDNNPDNSPMSYNTLSTTKGEQSPYPLVLSDGTKVWLNAASSVTFPTVFVGKDRLVKVTGEAYFEVAHNATRPFKIAVKGQIIEDIGTNFNINAYDNEPAIKTTLIEGSVRVIKATEAAVIKPGQQAITHLGSNSIAVRTADLEEAMAWKNGLFLFKKADMQTVMRQLERWYNVEVVYEGKVPQREFNGDIHRNLNASEVLDVLSYYKVHFRIDGKKIIVKE